MPEHRFANRTVLVTGAASGIGAATARLFATEGATVYGLFLGTKHAIRAMTSRGGNIVNVSSGIARARLSPLARYVLAL